MEQLSKCDEYIYVALVFHRNQVLCSEHFNPVRSSPTHLVLMKCHAGFNCFVTAKSILPYDAEDAYQAG